MCFVFDTKIQDGRQKWQENNSWEKSPHDFADTLGSKNFIKITLSCTVSERHVSLNFMQNIELRGPVKSSRNIQTEHTLSCVMSQNGGKAILGKSCQ